MTDLVSFVIEVIGTVAFAASGALVAIEKKMDVLGVVILGITTAVGGGILRDIILGHTPPQAFVHPVYIIIASATALIVFLPRVRAALQSQQPAYEKTMLVMDSLGLGVFTVVGMHAADGMAAGLFLRVFVGVVTGVGGGVLRDMMSQNAPYIFRKHFYCSATIIGAILAAMLWNVLDRGLVMLVGAGTVFLLRMLAAHYRWKLPRA